jgi:hypothetical protein
MYIGKPQRVFTIEPVEHPVPRKNAEPRSVEAAVLEPSATEASLSVAGGVKARTPRPVLLDPEEPR